MNKRIITEIERTKRLMGLSESKQLLREINFGFLGRLIGRTELDALIPSLEAFLKRPIAGASNLEKLGAFIAEKPENGRLIMNWMIKNDIVPLQKLATEILHNDAELEGWLVTAFSKPGNTFDEIKNFFQAELKDFPLVVKNDGTKVSVADEMLKLAQSKASTQVKPNNITPEPPLPKPSNIEPNPATVEQPPLPKPSDVSPAPPPKPYTSTSDAMENLKQRYRAEDPNYVIFESSISRIPDDLITNDERDMLVSAYAKIGNWTPSQVLSELAAMKTAENQVKYAKLSPIMKDLIEEAKRNPDQIIKKTRKAGLQIVLAFVALTVAVGAAGVVLAKWTKIKNWLNGNTTQGQNNQNRSTITPPKKGGLGGAIPQG